MNSNAKLITADGKVTAIEITNFGPNIPYEGVDLPKMIAPFSMQGTFTPGPDFRELVDDLAAKRQQEDDEDGGMHVVGVQMFLGYEEGQFSMDDIMVRLA